MKSKPLSLHAFITGLSHEKERPRFAELSETTVAHLAQLAGGHRRASPALARRMARASERMFDDPERHLSLSAIRPDIWPAPRRRSSKPSPRSLGA